MIRSASIPVLLLVLMGLVGCGGQSTEKPPPKDQVVKIYPAQSEQVTDYEEFTGRTEAYRYVEVRAMVTGYLKKIYFQDGADVTKDQRLFQIDQRPFRAALNQAKANFRLAEAHFRTMERVFKRAKGLREQGGAVSQEEYDKALGDRDEAEGAVGVARAARDTAQINFDYTEVVAPMSGRLGRRLVDPGNTVQTSATPLTTIVDLDKIYATFDIDERTFLRIRELMKKGQITSAQDNSTKINLGLADSKGYTLKGTIDFEDNQLDVSTGTYRVRAVVNNPIISGRDHFLSPGMFLRAQLPIGRPHRAVLVPEVAITNDQGQKVVWVVNKANRCEYRKVALGSVHHGMREILNPSPLETKGLKAGEHVGVNAGERVITKGVQKVRANLKVNPQPDKDLDLSEKKVSPVPKNRPGKPVGP